MLVALGHTGEEGKEMTERQALAEALRLAKQMRDDWDGPTFPGRTHKLRNEQIPKLLEILRKGLMEASDG